MSDVSEALRRLGAPGVAYCEWCHIPTFNPEWRVYVDTKPIEDAMPPYFERCCSPAHAVKHARFLAETPPLPEGPNHTKIMAYERWTAKLVQRRARCVHYGEQSPKQLAQGMHGKSAFGCKRGTVCQCELPCVDDMLGDKFEARPSEPFDSFYCGCRGYDGDAWEFR